MSIISWQGSTIGSEIGNIAGQTLGAGINAWAGQPLSLYDFSFGGYGWNIVKGTGITCTDDVLNINHDGDATNEVYDVAQTAEPVSGDFDLQVDISPITLSSLNGWEMRLYFNMGEAAGATCYYWMALMQGSYRRMGAYYRPAGGSEIKDAQSSGSWATERTWRMVRVDSTITVYHKALTESTWTQLGGGYTFAEAYDGYPRFTCYSHLQYYPDVEFDFSNFTIS